MKALIRKSNLFAIFILVANLFFVSTAFGQSTTLDQADLDYAPGETVYITGSGWQPNELIELQVEHLTEPVPDHGTPNPHLPWTIVADGSGNFNASWYVTEYELGSELLLIADGLESGFTYELFFTDGNVRFNASGLPNSASVNVSYSYSTVSSSISFTTPGNSSNISPAPANGTSFTYTFPATIISGGDTYTLSPAGSQTATIVNGQNTFTGTYFCSSCVGGLLVTAPACAQGGSFTINYSPASGSNITIIAATPSSFSAKKNTTYTISAITSTVNGNSYTGLGTIIGTTPNTSGYSSTVTLAYSDTQAPAISCPSNISKSTDAGLCTAVVTYTAPVGTDNCPGQSTAQTAGLPSGSAFPKGITTNTFEVTDASGNKTSCSFTVTVNDTQPPVISGVGADVTINCPATPSFSSPTVSDNCPGVTLGYADVTTPGSCAGNYSIKRTWTATDTSGLTATASQTITVQDTTDPVLSPAPADATVECDSVPTASAADLTATDNCDVAPVVTYGEVRTDGDCPSRYTLTRTWTATDACGNDSSKAQTITVQDTTDPVLSPAPADATVECDAVPTASAADLTATDNCDVAPVVTYGEVRTDGDCPSRYTLTRTWTATDACGNDSSKAQTITVQDTTDPVLSPAPADATVECDSVPTASAADLTATDNCDVAPVVTYGEVRTDGDCPSRYTLTRTWTATDACGNDSSKAQTITVQDTTDPVLSPAPADATVECDAVPTASAADLTATDNCDVAPVVTYGEVRTDGDCPSRYTLTRTWTATDACGNDSSKVQTITVQDTTDPVLSPAPADTTVECDAVPTAFAADLTATDNCDVAPVVTYGEVRTDGDCPSRYTLTRTWTATDACGNDSSKAQTITVQDTTDPVLSPAPADATVECDSVPTASAADLTATDNCDVAPVVTYSEVRTDGDCPSRYTLTRTWTATDACGNDSSKAQTITVQDTTDPVLSPAPADATVECDAVPTASAADLTATDNCDVAPVVTYGEVRTDGDCPSRYTLTRTWTATDACGNDSSKVQTITVQDTTDPVLSPAPADTTAECDAVPTAFAADLTATDNCDVAPVVTYGEVRTDGDCPSRYTLTRTWTATDACGNDSSKVQTITVQDTTDPVLSPAPADATVECDSVPTASAADLIATDNCDVAPVVTYGEVRTDGDCPSRYTLTRTWTATDACGNDSSKVQTITVQDTTDPVLSPAPADATVECDAVPTASAADLTATDNCDAAPVVTYGEVRTDGDCPSRYTLTRTWTATDACGNDSSKAQTITVQDTTDPVLSPAPADATVECDAVPTASAADLTATDNCDVAPVVTYGEVRTDGDCPSRYTLTRTWTATDACGNDSSKVQTITVQDTTDPVLSPAPADTTVECDAVPTAFAADLTATDNCDVAPVVTYGEVRTDGDCPSRYTLTRTWTATDACGNDSSKVQTITVQDTTDPVLSPAPEDTTAECDAVPTAFTADLTATDNCDVAPVVTYGEVRTDGDCPSRYTLTRTWTATDACGNDSSKVQTITVQDTTDPVLSPAPADATVECDAVPTAFAADLTATDNCDVAPVVTYGEVRTDGDCPSRYTLTRTWTATDACGNDSSKVQTITVQDTTDPVLSPAPADATVECDAVPTASAADLTATDNCDVAPVVTYGEVRTDGDCPSRYTLTRTWTATDACGNDSSKAQTINGQDTTDPVLSPAPADATVECDAVPTASAADLTATDNCDVAPVVTYGEVRTDGDCPSRYTLTRTWTATDACGNDSSKVQTINVQDITAPTFSICPSDIILSACVSTATWSIVASDTCSGVTVTQTAGPPSGSTFANGTTTTISYKATDGCGNYSTCSFTVTRAAVLSASETHTAILCNGGTSTVIISATGGTTPYSGTGTFAQSAGTVSYTVTDANGCTTNVSVTVGQPSALLSTCTNNNPNLYFGYAGDQTSIFTVSPSGGTGPYTVSIALSRSLLCNQINDTGDETFIGGSGGSTSGNTCFAFPNTASSIPVSTKTISSGSYSVTVSLMADADIIATITDSNGCITTCTKHIKAEDVRCFAGKSGNAKVKLCHKTNSTKNPCVTICVDDSAVAEHLAHGDFFGTCTSDCQVSGGNTKSEEPFNVKAYPNPSENQFTLAMKNGTNENVEVVVFDILGRMVRHIENGDSKFIKFGEELPAGAYIVIVRQGENQKSIILVKVMY